MRTSLVEVAELEDYLLGTGEAAEVLVTEARIHSSPAWEQNARMQLRSYELIRQYGRELLTAEIKEVEAKVLSDRAYRSFQNRIMAIFK